MKTLLRRVRQGYGKKLAALHAWNGWVVVLLAVSGLVLLNGAWRGTLGEARVWLKQLHIAVGVASLLPVLYYLLLAGKHWKQLRDKPWQKANVLIVLGLLIGWLASGALLWQFRLVGPAAANRALIAHDLLTWIGLPYILYHSVTRVKWLKDPRRRSVRLPRDESPASGRLPSLPETPPAPATDAAISRRPLISRRAFIRGAIGVGLAVAVGPTFLRWLGSTLNPGSASGNIDSLLENDANRLTPEPLPLPGSAPPIGGGAKGRFRVYSVTKIPAFNNENWSFSIDGLVDRPTTWNWETFVNLKRTVQVSDFHCVTGWSVYDNTWEGIPVRVLLAMAGVKSGATSAIFHSGDGVYTSGITLEQLARDDAMVAVLHDGKPIPDELGGPVRLIMPKMYAYKSVKWLNRIELIEGVHVGYWERRGYENEAWV